MDYTIKKIVKISRSQIEQGKYLGKDLKPKRFVQFINKKVGCNKHCIFLIIINCLLILDLVFLFICVWMFCFTRILELMSSYKTYFKLQQMSTVILQRLYVKKAV